MLGSGLASVAREHVDGGEVSYEKLEGAPLGTLAGHPGVARIGTWAGVRVVAFAGRAHLYQGFDAREVTYFVRLAAALAARTLVLTNAAGGLNERFSAGDVMLISDQLNLTGCSISIASAETPFLNVIDAYDPRLRALARESAGIELHEGVYAGVRGPAFETPAEARALRLLGADAVGMSTVLETLAARALGLDVLGLSLISNLVGPARHVSHTEVLAASQRSAGRLARVIEGFLRAYAPTVGP